MENSYIKTTKTEEAASFIASSISKQLKNNRRVLFFLSGGSSMPVGVSVFELLREEQKKSGEKNFFNNLTVTLTDERYGVMDHNDSNLHQLLEKGFDPEGVKFIPILTGDDPDITTVKFNAILDRELKLAEYKIGLFGIGADGHTAGILPESAAASSREFAFGYDTPIFFRITITPKAIERLDEAVVWVQGENKWNALDNLEKDLEISEEPAQVFKKVPLLTIFTDYNKA